MGFVNFDGHLNGRSRADEDDGAEEEDEDREGEDGFDGAHAYIVSCRGAEVKQGGEKQLEQIDCFSPP